MNMQKILKFLKEYGPYFLALIIVLLIKFFVVSPIRVNGPSMEPTLYQKDIMILDKISYRFTDIKRFDIVVIDCGDEYLIKRVIGLPGEKIEYIDNKLYVNDEEVEENFEHEATKDFDIAHALNSETVPEGEYLVLGDNRLNSMDSRTIGFISKKAILGKTSYTILPFNRFGKKE